MNRRSFFQSLGAAVLGTAIALKLPDSLIPISKIPEPNKVPIPTFAQLNELYEKSIQYGDYPKYMIFSEDMLKAIESQLGEFTFYPAKDNGMSVFMGWRFRGVWIKSSKYQPDEMVYIDGDTYGSSGRLNLLTGKII